MNSIAPGVSKGFDLFGFAGDVGGVAVLDVSAGGGPLEIAVELDAVRGVEIDALDLASESFAFGEAGHDHQGIAEDHPVGPVLVVLIEVGFVDPFGDAVEVGIEVGEEQGLGVGVALGLGGLAEEVVDQGLGLDLLLDIKRRGMNDEVGPILFVLAAPDELGIKVLIPAAVSHADRGLLVVFHHRLILHGRDILASALGVLDRFDGFLECGFLGHGESLTR